MNATEFQLLLYSIALRTLSHSPFNNKTLKQYINIIAKLSALAINTVDSNICVGGTFFFFSKNTFSRGFFLHMDSKIITYKYAFTVSAPLFNST